MSNIKKGKTTKFTVRASNL